MKANKSKNDSIIPFIYIGMTEMFFVQRSLHKYWFAI